MSLSNRIVADEILLVQQFLSQLYIRSIFPQLAGFQACGAPTCSPELKDMLLFHRIRGGLDDLAATVAITPSYVTQEASTVFNVGDL